ncbi:uncharacterized protein METZ01_LOCUS237572, partial [marine metagenome]
TYVLEEHLQIHTTMRAIERHTHSVLW